MRNNNNNNNSSGNYKIGHIVYVIVYRKENKKCNIVYIEIYVLIIIIIIMFVIIGVINIRGGPLQRGSRLAQDRQRHGSPC